MKNRIMKDWKLYKEFESYEELTRQDLIFIINSLKSELETTNKTLANISFSL